MNENYVTLGQVCDKGSSNIAQKDLAEREGQYPIYGAAGLIKNVDFAHQKQPYIAVVKDGAGIGRVMKLPAYSSVIGTMQYIFPKENVDIDYLFYALQHMNLGKYFSGSTIPHIYFRDYQKERLKLPVMEVQQSQADTLSRIDALSAYGQRQIALMDEIVKSRFVEMFGDRDSFAAFPLESNVEEMFIGPFGSSLKNECFVPENEGYCMVYEQKHAIRKTMKVETRYVTEEKYKELKRFNVQGGDIIVSCRGTIGETYIVPENAPLGIMHPSIMKIRLKSSAYNSVFFDCLLQDTLQKHNTDVNGSGVKMAVTANTLGKEVFIQPAMHLQNRFAAFVAEVDKSKLAVQQSLEKLETLKKSLMQQYFG